MRWCDQDLAEARPRLPARLVERPDLLASAVRALCARERLVAVAGVGGAGKSILARQACAERQVRRTFRDGVCWLEAGPGKDPIALLADLAGWLGVTGTALRFGTAEQGRDQLAAALSRRRLLIAVDNVQEPRQLHVLTGLPPGCTVLFTTRLAELGQAVKATEVLVGELAQDQALELLGRWTGQPPEALPDAAHALCARLGSLALSVATAGAMVAQGRSFAEVLASIRRDPTHVRAGVAAAQRYRTLFDMIEASIACLREADQARYAQLAVFARCGPFPRDAAQALWQPELSDAGLDDLLATLTGRCMLTAAGDGWYAAHDLHYDVLQGRLGDDGLRAAHSRLLEGYRRRYPGGLADSVSDPYLARTLAGHLHGAHLIDEVRALLADAAWIQARLTHGQLPGLASDYGYAGDPLTRQILRALRRSAPVLAADPTQVRGQLASRLIGHPDPGISAWAAGLTRQVDGLGAALAPVAPAPADNPLEHILTGHTDPVRAVAITPDGTRAVSGGDDGTLRVWDLTAGRQHATLTGHTDWVRAVAITPDGTRAISGGDDGTLRVWDLTAGCQHATLTGHTRPIWSLAITADGSRAISGGDDGSLRVWDLTAGRRHATLTGHSRPIWSVAITPDGTRAVSGGGDGILRVWDLTAGRQHATLTGHTGEVFSVAMTPDGTQAVSGGSDGSLRVWDLTAGRQHVTLTGHVGWVRAVAVTPDATRAVSGGEDGALRVWDLTAGRQHATLTGHARQVHSVAVTPDGTRAISGGDDGSLRVWDLTASGEHAILTGWIFSVAVTPDGTRAVSGGSDGTLRVWDLTAGRQHATLTGHTRPIWSVAITPDGTRAISGSGDGTLRVWDLTASGEDATLTILTGHIGQASHASQVFSVAITPDGTRAASGDGSDLRIWDLASGRVDATLTGHTGHVFCVAVTPDGTRAVSGSGDGTLRVWDLAAGRQHATLTGHAGHVFCVAVTPDGTRAVSGGEDASVRVWDLASGAELARWVGDHPIIGCTALPGPPVRIGVGQGQGPPCLLEFRTGK